MPYMCMSRLKVHWQHIVAPPSKSSLFLSDQANKHAGSERQANVASQLSKTARCLPVVNFTKHCLHHFFLSYNENRRVMDFGYPKYISENFPGINSTINAAVYKEGEQHCAITSHMCAMQIETSAGCSL